MKIDLELYVVVNADGKFMRAKGYGGYGESWVDDINKAKIYPKIGPARGRVTWWYTNYPEYGRPIILKLSVKKGEIIDEEDRVVKAVEKKVALEKERRRWWLEHDVFMAQKGVDIAQKKLDEELNREPSNLNRINILKSELKYAEARLEIYQNRLTTGETRV